jgi:hypothetical protein
LDFPALTDLSTITAPQSREVIIQTEKLKQEMESLWSTLIPGFRLEEVEYEPELDPCSYFSPGAIRLKG